MDYLRRTVVRVMGLPLALAMLLGLGLIAPSSATASTGSTPTPVTGAEADAAIDVVMNQIAAGGITVNAPTSSLDESKATVQAIGSEQGTFTAVTLPVSGGYSLVSNFSVLLDPMDAVAQYSETLFSKNDAANFQIVQYADGKLVKDEDTGIAYKTNAELLAEMQDAPQGPVVQGTGAVVACLAAVLGVGGTVGYLIVAACAGACAAAGSGFSVPICVACIGAYAAIGGASIGAVVACFDLL